MELNTILLILAIVLLLASLLVKGYGMMQLANKSAAGRTHGALQKNDATDLPHVAASDHHCALSGIEQIIDKSG